MIVKLIKYTPDPEKICAAAALSCYSNKNSGKLIKSLTKKKIKRIIDEIIEKNHLSVIEHATFTFNIGNVSRVLTHQLVRHRIASYSQQSQRYIELLKPNYIVPDKIMNDKEALIIYNEFMTFAWKTYNNLIKNNIPIEDARYVLPNAATTNITITMNARELLHFFKLRCCMRSQWEIRKMALKMLAEVKKVAPNIFNIAGPPCNNCPEIDFKCKIRNKKNLNGKC